MKYSEDGYKRSKQAAAVLTVAGLGLGAWVCWDFFLNWSGMDMAGFILRLLCLVGAIFLFSAGRLARNITPKFPHYGKLIIDREVRSIGLLAQQTGATPQIVRREVKNMISQKVLLNATLTDDDKILDLSDDAPPIDKDLFFDGTCPGCGAILTEKGGKVICEYCGKVFK